MSVTDIVMAKYFAMITVLAIQVQLYRLAIFRPSPNGIIVVTVGRIDDRILGIALGCILICKQQTADITLIVGDIAIGVTALSDRAKDLRSADLKKMAVVIGSEGQGVRKEILDNADAELIIPMNPRCESLNAAVAATIVLWEMAKV